MWKSTPRWPAWAPRHTLYVCFDDEEPGKRVQTAYREWGMIIPVAFWHLRWWYGEQHCWISYMLACMHAKPIAMIKEDPIYTACCNMDYVHLALASLLLIQWWYIPTMQQHQYIKFGIHIQQVTVCFRCTFSTVYTSISLCMHAFSTGFLFFEAISFCLLFLWILRSQWRLVRYRWWRRTIWKR